MTLRSYWTSKCAECPLKTQHDWQGAHGIYFRRGQTILLEGEACVLADIMMCPMSYGLAIGIVIAKRWIRNPTLPS
jgi:hypothetical protein